VAEPDKNVWGGCHPAIKIKKIETQPLFDRNLSCDIMAFDIVAFVSNCDSGCINNI
jgi:hypothetical protein